MKDTVKTDGQQRGWLNSNLKRGKNNDDDFHKNLRLCANNRKVRQDGEGVFPERARK